MNFKIKLQIISLFLITFSNLSLAAFEDNIVNDKNKQMYKCTWEEYQEYRKEFQKMLSEIKKQNDLYQEKIKYQASLPKIEIDENGYANIFFIINSDEISFTMEDLEKSNYHPMGLFNIDYKIKNHYSFKTNFKGLFDGFKSNKIKYHSFTFPNGNIYPSNKTIRDYEIIREKQVGDEISFSLRSESTKSWGLIYFNNKEKIIEGKYVYKGFIFNYYSKNGEGIVWSIEK